MGLFFFRHYVAAVFGPCFLFFLEHLQQPRNAPRAKKAICCAPFAWFGAAGSASSSRRVKIEHARSSSGRAKMQRALNSAYIFFNKIHR